MSLLTITFVTEAPNTLIRSSRWNTDFTDITTFINNKNLDSTDNIADGGVSTAALANLAVTDAKIAGITTPGKVNGSSFTGLSSIPSGAGIIPVANIDTGTTANKIVKLDSSAKLPAVDGSQLTNIFPIGASQVSGIIGSPVSKSENTIYQATTDGFFVGIITAGTSASGGRIEGYTDSSATPTTLMGAGNVHVNTGASSQSSVVTQGSFCIPIKKGNYYKGVLTESHSGSAATAVYYFIPLGS